jgi:hypothetical protein
MEEVTARGGIGRVRWPPMHRRNPIVPVRGQMPAISPFRVTAGLGTVKCRMPERLGEVGVGELSAALGQRDNSR